MSLKHKFLPGAVVDDKTLGDRQIRVVVSTPSPDRVKDVMEPRGVDLTAYKSNPIVLADHNREAPIGTALIDVKSDRVEAVITFAPAGASAKADEYCALAKGGVLNTVSPGFIELEVDPIKGGGYHIKRWELLELSLVSVPCNPEATVIERKLPERNWRVGASLNLPLAPAGAKGAALLETGIDAKTAHKGFLAYDSGAAGADAYRIPFARLVDGRMMVDRKSLAAARAELAGADFPADVMTKASAVLDHYQAKIDAARPARRIKGLYEVACLAGVLSDLGWIEDMAEMEAEWEGDESPVPQMLVDAMRALGAALVAMTVEEVAELLGDEAQPEGAESGAVSSEKSAKAYARKLSSARTKAGRALSKATSERIAAACKMIESGHADLKAMIAEAETPAEDAGEDEPAESKPESKSIARAAAKFDDEARAREIEILRLKAA